MVKKVLVTGATGFVGKYLVKDLISANLKVVAFVLPDEDRSELENLGVNDFVSDLRDMPQVDIVVHLAGRVHQMKDKAENPLLEFRKINVDFTIETAKEALKKGVKKFIFISSVKVYGEKSGKYSELNELNPQEPYAISKYEAEKKLQELFKNTNSKLVIIRFPMVYGPGNKGNMLMLLKATKNKIYLPLTGAKAKRSLLYVRNATSAITTIALNDKEINNIDDFNLTDGIDVAICDLYRILNLSVDGKYRTFYFPEFLFKLIAIFSTKFRLIYIRLFGEYRFSNSKFRKIYQWEPPFVLEKGLKDTVLWYVNKN